MDLDFIIAGLEILIAIVDIAILIQIKKKIKEKKD